MKNDYIQQNINLLFVNPLLLTALPLGIFVSAGGPRAVKPEKYLRILWTCAAAAGILTQLLRLFPVFPQQNQSTAALLLPLLLVFSLAAEGPLFPPAPGKKAAPTG
jgi:hypothetical protein